MCFFLIKVIAELQSKITIDCYCKTNENSFFVFFTPAKTVTELVNDERLDAFARQIRNAGLEERFENFDSYTLFAPSEAAMYCKRGNWKSVIMHLLAYMLIFFFLFFFFWVANAF